MKTKSLLIIGGTGFFGKSILKYLSTHKELKKKFNKVFILSRGKLKLTKYNTKLKKNFKIIKINSDILTIKNLPLVDYVIYASILKNYKDDHKAVKNYLNLAKKYHLKSKILYISSGAVYGEQPNSTLEFRENYLQLNKKNAFKTGYKKEYSKIKLSNEKLFQKFGSSGGKVSIARCFTFVGEYLPINSYYVVGNFIKSILKNSNINVNANYEVIRSYMHENDLVEWLFKILDHSNKSCPLYNVGSNDAISIHELVRILVKKYKLNTDSLNIKIMKNKCDKYIPNINKAKKELNLKLKYTSLEAIDDTVNSLKI
jgi:dTDP-glucose 4,6-dehydratase